jgi:beta-aspartyl-peptidase (threonine type)
MTSSVHDQNNAGWKLVIHGGAGVMKRSRMTAEQDREIRSALDHALTTGSQVLGSGGSAIDAVEAAVRELEDDPNFNAGRGAVFTYDGQIELDAAIMDGRTRDAGAVTGVTTTRHPISAARAVMDNSEHVFLSRGGADEFARCHGLEQVPNDWFGTGERRRQLDELKTTTRTAFDVELKYGTVGAVAVDAAGHVAAATSTGGLTGKRWDRIGDSPIIGAGTYADDGSAAVSATGAGEYFIRVAAAHQLAARVAIGGEALQQALDAVLEDIRKLGGSGGLIAVSPNGEGAWGFTTPGMYRGMADANGRRIGLYSEEEER